MIIMLTFVKNLFREKQELSIKIVNFTELTINKK